MNRRNFITGSIASLAVGATAMEANAQRIFHVKPQMRPQTVRAPWRLPSGTVVIDHKSRYLYLILHNGRARRYAVGVGSVAMTWKGTARIAKKREWPSWTPTKYMIHRNPKKYGPWAGGMPGGPNNPLGARALYLHQNGRDTLYRIHGTNDPWSVGTNNTSGCIRMINDHVIDLYDRVPIGTKVIVLGTY